MAAKQKGKPRPQPVPRPASAPRAAAPKTARETAAAPVLTQTFAPGFWRQHWLPAVLFIALAFVLYGQAIRFGYVLDDEMVIWNNAYVQKGWSGLSNIFAFDSFMGYFQDKQKLYLLEGGRYRPLSLATFAVEAALFGKPGPELAHISHFINILLYGLTGVLLYRILLGLFPLREGRRWWFSAAFLGAALFVLHPLHSEAVANIKGRDEILALLFSLGALYFTLKHFDTGRTWQLLAAGGSLLLGMLAKENALTFVAVIPLTVWFFARVPAGRVLSAAWPLLAAALLFILIRYKALGFMVDHGRAMNDLMNDSFLGMSIGEKFATIFLTLGWYVKLLFVPYPLTHDYYPYHVPKVGWSDWRALASLALYLGMTVWAVLNLRRRQVPAYAIVFFLLTLSIVSNLFVSVGTFMNERFLYMPSVGFCLLGGWFLAEKLPVWFRAPAGQPSILGAGLFVAAVAAFGWIIWQRVPDWESKKSLNTSAVKNSPNSARAHCFYAVAIYEEVLNQEKDPVKKAALVDTMDYHLTRALEINPNYASAWQMLPGVAAARFDAQRVLQAQQGGKGPQMDRLFNDFDHALEKAPNNASIRKFIPEYVEYLAGQGGNPNKIVSFCYHQGYERFFQNKQFRDPQLALRFLEAGLKTQFEDERLFTALAEVYQATGNAAKAAEMQQRAAVARTIDPGK